MSKKIAKKQRTQTLFFILFTIFLRFMCFPLYFPNFSYFFILFTIWLCVMCFPLFRFLCFTIFSYFLEHTLKLPFLSFTIFFTNFIFPVFLFFPEFFRKLNIQPF